MYKFKKEDVHENILFLYKHVKKVDAHFHTPTFLLSNYQNQMPSDFFTAATFSAAAALAPA